MAKQELAADLIIKAIQKARGKVSGVRLSIGNEYHIRNENGTPIANVSVIGEDNVALNRIHDGQHIKTTTIERAEKAAKELGHSFHRGHVSTTQL